jgi:cytochrome b561
MGEETSRYDAVAVALHWLIGVALLAQITFGFLLDEIAPRGTPSRSAVINLHKSFGLVLAVAILARLAWRLGHRAPPWPATMPEWQQRAALRALCLHAAHAGVGLRRVQLQQARREVLRPGAAPLGT